MLYKLSKTCSVVIAVILSGLLSVVDAQLMVKLVRETKSYRDTARKSPGATSTDSGTVSITLVKTGKRIVVRLNIEDAIPFLESLKNICGGDISLCSDLQEFQDRMRAMSSKSENGPRSLECDYFLKRLRADSVWSRSGPTAKQQPRG